jgi:hypothetical protein
MASNEVKIWPKSGRPFREITWSLGVSDAVEEKLGREGIADAFGAYLTTPQDPDVADVIVDLHDGGHASVRVESVNYGDFYLMTLAEEVDDG